MYFKGRETWYRVGGNNKIIAIRDRNIESLQKRIIRIIETLREEYPDSRCSLNYKNHWELLVATILSAQCTDERVNKITPTLFNKFPDPESTARASQTEIEALIKSAGLYRNKAYSISSAAKVITKQFAGRVPDKLESLKLIPGIGRKTANVILGVGFNIPAITVDTHVRRISQRLGLTNNNDPVKIEKDLMEIVPRSEWIGLGHLFIEHGRKVCTARKPKCVICELKKLCPSFTEI